MIVKKAVKMAAMMNIPVLGIVENMAYVKCPDCGKRIDIFGDNTAKAKETFGDIPLLGEIPMDAKLAALCDKGIIELMENEYLDDAADILETLG